MTAIRSLKANIGATIARVIPAKTRVCAYVRVSTDQQHTDNQKADIIALANSRGWKITEWLEENDSAWTAGHQSELAQLFDSLRDGKKRFDFLIVWALDRLTREGPAKQFVYLYELSQYKCTLVSVREPWVEANDLTRDLLLTITSYMARAESQRRSERIRAGNARMLKDGVTKSGRKVTQLGRPKGAKDKKKRRRAGYLQRYARNANNLSRIPTLEGASVE